MNAKLLLRDSYPRPSRCRWYAIPISYQLHRESVPESTTQGGTQTNSNGRLEIEGPAEITRPRRPPATKQAETRLADSSGFFRADGPQHEVILPIP